VFFLSWFIVKIMEWYWVLGIAVVIFVAVEWFAGEALISINSRDNGASSIVGALACILFVLIMIYDKL
jgi:hypothetical protein